MTTVGEAVQPRQNTYRVYLDLYSRPMAYEHNLVILDCSSAIFNTVSYMIISQS